jgi:outer membrane immunogenic protein
MKTFFKLCCLTALAVVALAGASASAADLAVKAPVYKAPVPIITPWTGFYAGVNVGYSWGRTHTDYSAVSTNNGSIPELTSDSADMNGVIGGGQIGYNYQFDRNFVAGFEADFQGSGERGSGDPLVCQNPAACDFGNINDAYTEKLEWFGTLRGRLGYLATPNLLLYGTAGLAYGELRRDDNYVYSAFLFCNQPPAGAGACTGQSGSTSAVKAGWTAGAGVEMKMTANWSGRVEYLYVDLAGLGTSTFTLTSGNPTPIFLTTTSHAFTDNILRVGVDYQFTH